MIIIGELLNSTRPAIRRAMADRDADLIKTMAEGQQEAGADYLDVNAGAFAEEELDYLKWLIETVRETSQLPLCIDSPKPEALSLGCELAGGKLLINSISAEKKRFESVLPLVKEHNASVIALAMDDTGLSDDEGKMYDVACGLVDNLQKEGIEPSRILLDLLVRPISAGSQYGPLFLNLLKRVRGKYQHIHFVCGLSNISYGLPRRKIINRAFLLLSMAAGLDAAILDPLDDPMMAQIKATEALLGIDDYCMNYIAAARAGKFDTVG